MDSPGCVVHIPEFDEGKGTQYQVKRKGNGVYVFVLSGSIQVDGQTLESRDGFGVWDVESLDLKAISSSVKGC